MLAAQVNARKHDKLRMILGIAWSWGLCFCEALLCWAVIAVAAGGRGFGLIWLVGRLSTPLVCVLAGAEGHPCTVFGSLVGWELAALHSCYVLMLDLCA